MRHCTCGNLIADHRKTCAINVIKRLKKQREGLVDAVHRLLACPALTLESDEQENEMAINQANVALVKAGALPCAAKLEAKP